MVVLSSKTYVKEKMRTQDNQFTDTEMALVNTLSTLSLQAKCLCSNTRLSCNLWPYFSNVDLKAAPDLKAGIF